MIDEIGKLLDRLFLDNTIVSIDAMAYQKNIAAKIVVKKTDYLLQIKDNQLDTMQQIMKLFEKKIRLNLLL